MGVVGRAAANEDILDLDRDDVTASKLAVDRQVNMARSRARPSILEFRPDRPDVFGSQRWLPGGAAGGKTPVFKGS